MKVLSIRQPWAWLIVNGHKDVENRSWFTKYRGEFLIHAGKKLDLDGYQWVLSEMGITLPQLKDFKCGGIVGKATIIDCVTEHKSKWFSGLYGFVLKGAEPLSFVPMKGRLGFFEVDVKNKF